MLVLERFWSKVDKTGDCWLWMGALDSRGKYGRFYVGGGRAAPVSKAAHVFAYEQEHGPVPNGHELDHLPTCSKRCVRTAHLRPATRKQNMENLSGAHQDSRTGVRGVTFYKGAFVGQVTHNGRNYYCGRYPTIEQAEAAVIAKRRELFTHNDIDRIAV